MNAQLLRTGLPFPHRDPSTPPHRSLPWLTALCVRAKNARSSWTSLPSFNEPSLLKAAQLADPAFTISDRYCDAAMPMSLLPLQQFHGRNWVSIFTIMRASCFHHWDELKFKSETTGLPASDRSVSAVLLTQCRTETDRDLDPLNRTTRTAQDKGRSR